MKKIIFLLFISISGYGQITITTNSLKLENYTINKVVDNQFQQSYKVTNIYDLSTTQVDIIKVNKVTNYNILETKFYKKEEGNLYKNVKSGFKKEEDDNYY